MRESKSWDKYAKSYFSEVVSPFEKGVENPIFDYIKKIPPNKDVIDIGTGIGSLLPILSKRFKVTAIDISPKMIESAKKKNKSVSFFIQDMRNLSSFYNKFDVAFSVNSVLSPEIKDVEKSLKEICKVLKNEGILLGIFPSMEAIAYHAQLVYESNIKHKSGKKALKDAKDKVQRQNCNFLLGTFDYGDMVQKNYYRFELINRLKNAGFKKIKIEKVLYPWEIFEEKHLLKFQGKSKLWDWFIYAEK